MDLAVEYQGLPIGKGRIQVEPAAGSVQLVRLEAQTTGLVSVIKLKQLLTSTLDLTTGLPRTSAIHSVENDYRSSTTTDYDREKNRAVVVKRGRSLHRDEIDVPADALDFLALVFRLRMLPLAAGATHEFHVLAGRNVSKVVAQVVDHETVSTRAGRFPAWKVRVPTNFSGEFSEKKPTYVWLSDDGRRLVLRISVELGIGRVAAELSGYDPGQRAAAR
jgi:hypothetical protein